MNLAFLTRPAVLAGACALLAAPLSAQWTDGSKLPVPLKADGTVDADAPAPVLPNGKPDFSGLWDTAGTDSVQDPSYAREGMEKYGVPYIPLRITFPEDQKAIPYQPWALKLATERVATDGADDPASKCLPSGSLIQYHIPPILEIVQRPDRVVLLFESTMAYRQVFMDGRALPEDPVPTYNGYSVGRWEGDTLVIESIGYNGKIWIDDYGTPTTDQLKVTERWRRPSFGKIDIELTFEDPGAFTKPYVRHHTLSVGPSIAMMETYCLDENRFIQQMTPAAATSAAGE